MDIWYSWLFATLRILLLNFMNHSHAVVMLVVCRFEVIVLNLMNYRNTVVIFQVH